MMMMASSMWYKNLIRNQTMCDIQDAIKTYGRCIETHSDFFIRPAFLESQVHYYTKFHVAAAAAMEDDDIIGCLEEFVREYKNNARRMIALIIGYKERGIKTDNQLIGIFWDNLALTRLPEPPPPPFLLGRDTCKSYQHPQQKAQTITSTTGLGADWEQTCDIDKIIDGDDEEDDDNRNPIAPASSPDFSYSWRHGKTMEQIMEYVMMHDESYLRKDVSFLVGPNCVVITAHCIQLALISPVLEWTLFDSPMVKDLRRGHHQTHLCISLEDTSPSAFWMLLQYIYCRTIDCYSDVPHIFLKQSINLWKLARSLEIGIIANHASSVVLNELMDLKNYAKILEVAISIHDMRSTKRIIDFVVANAASIFYGVEFLFLSSKAMHYILERDDLCNITELAIYNAVICWADHRSRRRRANNNNESQLGQQELSVTGKELRKELGMELFLIRFPLMTQSEFTDFVKEGRTKGLLKIDDEIEMVEEYWKLPLAEQTRTMTVGLFSAKQRTKKQTVPATVAARVVITTTTTRNAVQEPLLDSNTATGQTTNQAHQSTVSMSDMDTLPSTQEKDVDGHVLKSDAH